MHADGSVVELMHRLGLKWRRFHRRCRACFNERFETLAVRFPTRTLTNLRLGRWAAIASCEEVFQADRPARMTPNKSARRRRDSVNRSNERTLAQAMVGSMLGDGLSLSLRDSGVEPIWERWWLGWWAADDRVVCGEAAVSGDRCDVPLDVDAVADAAHEGREAAVAGVDDEPACRLAAGGAERVREAGWRGDEAAGADGDLLALGSDLEGEPAFENVEGLGVLVDVWVGHAFARCAAGIGEAEVLRLRRGG